MVTVVFPTTPLVAIVASHTQLPPPSPAVLVSSPRSVMLVRAAFVWPEHIAFDVVEL
jgi:hypothetical protein